MFDFSKTLFYFVYSGDFEFGLAGDARLLKHGHLMNRLEVLFQFYLWDQSQVTIVWNTRETGDINDKNLKKLDKKFS